MTPNEINDRIHEARLHVYQAAVLLKGCDYPTRNDTADFVAELLRINERIGKYMAQPLNAECMSEATR